MIGYFVRVVAGFQVRQMLGQKKLWFLSLFLALPVGLTLLILRANVEYQHPFHAALHLYLLYSQTICILVAALYGTSLIQEELHGKTLTYLLTRPVPRWTLFIGKYAGTVATLFVLTMISWTFSWMLVYPGGGTRFVTAFALVNLLSLAVYTALFGLFGMLFPKHALFFSIGYGVVVEFFISLVPAVINKICFSYHLRSVLVKWLNLELPKNMEEIALIIGNLPVGWAIGALILFSVLLVAASSVLLTRREYSITEQI